MQMLDGVERVWSRVSASPEPLEEQMQEQLYSAAVQPQEKLKLPPPHEPRWFGRI